jgi:hypothetical protein
VPRVVRLGRPANDNQRRAWRRVHLAFVILASTLALIAILEWTLV